MSLTNQDKETIRAASKIFNICNSEIQICKPDDVSEVLTNHSFALIGIDCVGNFNLARVFAQKSRIRKIYRTREIAMLFPHLKTNEINENNLFIAFEKHADRREVVIFWTGE